MHVCLLCGRSEAGTAAVGLGHFSVEHDARKAESFRDAGDGQSGVGEECPCQGELLACQLSRWHQKSYRVPLLVPLDLGGDSLLSLR